MLNRVRHSSWVSLLVAGIAIGWALACQLICTFGGRKPPIAPPDPSVSAKPLPPAIPLPPPPASPDPKGPAPRSTWGGVTGGLTLVGLVVFFFYFLGLWYRGLRPDLEFMYFTALVAQLVTLLSLVGLQVKWGRHLAAGLGQNAYLGRLRHALGPRVLCFLVWLAVVGAIALFHWGYPCFATHYYNPRGVDALEAGRYSVAVEDFRQAVSLSPRDADAHYNLARAYEVLYEHEQAVAEYQLALELNDELLPAYNNLGRLYLLARDEPDAALTILLAGERPLQGDELHQVEKVVEQAVLHKNIGWAYLEKGEPHAALPPLQAATSQLRALANQGHNVSIYLAETYRLTALSYEKLEPPNEKEAKRAWADSQGHALAVRDSEVCRPPIRLAKVDCLNAKIWAAEAAGK